MLLKFWQFSMQCHQLTYCILVILTFCILIILQNTTPLYRHRQYQKSVLVGYLWHFSQKLKLSAKVEMNPPYPFESTRLPICGNQQVPHRSTTYAHMELEWKHNPQLRDSQRARWSEVVALVSNQLSKVQTITIMSQVLDLYCILCTLLNLQICFSTHCSIARFICNIVVVW